MQQIFSRCLELLQDDRVATKQKVDVLHKISSDAGFGDNIEEFIAAGTVVLATVAC